MAKVVITNCETRESKDIELEIAVGTRTARVTEGGGELFDLVGDWNPKNVGGVRFDLTTERFTLRDCMISGNGPGGVTLDFMSRE
jgi:hypothetical protein